MSDEKLPTPKFKLTKLGRFLGKKTLTWLILGGVGSIFLAGIELAMAAIIQLLLRAFGLLKEDIHFPIDLPEYWKTLQGVMVLLVLVGILRAASQFVMQQAGSSASDHLNARLRHLSTYDMLLRPKGAFVPASVVNSRFAETFLKAGAFCFGASQLASVLVQSAGISFYLFLTSPKEATVAFIGLGCIALWVLHINSKVRLHSHQLPIELNKLIAGVERVSRNWMLLRILRTQRQEYSKLSKNVSVYSRNHQANTKLINMAATGAPLVGIFLITGLIGLSQSVFHTPGLVLISALYLLLRLIQTLASGVSTFGIINQTWPQFKDAYRYYESFSYDEYNDALRNADLESTASAVSEFETGPILVSPPPEITVTDVSFSFNEGTPILRNVSFMVPAGTQTGITGPSGSGKSTLLGLILGTIEPTTGTVKFGGLPPAEYFAQPDVRVGFVGAEPFLIEGTVAENLQYGSKHKLSEEDCWIALEAACLDIYIRGTPEKLNYRINENGDGLSAGQRQRLALARAFAARPNVLILDEASSNLDKETEEQITDSIYKVLSGKATCLIVSHRQGLLKFANQVMKLNSGSLDG